MSRIVLQSTTISSGRSASCLAVEATLKQHRQTSGCAATQRLDWRTSHAAAPGIWQLQPTQRVHEQCGVRHLSTAPRTDILDATARGADTERAQPLRKAAARKALANVAPLKPPTVDAWLERSTIASAAQTTQALETLSRLPPAEVAAQAHAVVRCTQRLLSTAPSASQRLDWLSAAARVCATHRVVAEQLHVGAGAACHALCAASTAEAEHACAALDVSRLAALCRAQGVLGLLCNDFWRAFRSHPLAASLAAPADTAAMLHSAATVLQEHARSASAACADAKAPEHDEGASDAAPEQATSEGALKSAEDSWQTRVVLVRDMAQVLWADAVLKLPFMKGSVAVVAAAAPLLQLHIHISDADRDAVAEALQRQACNFAPTDAATAFGGLAEAGWHATTDQADAIQACGAAALRLLHRMSAESVAATLLAASRLAAPPQERLLPDTLLREVCAHASRCAQDAGGRAAAQMLRACVELQRSHVANAQLLVALAPRVAAVLPELTTHETEDVADALATLGADTNAEDGGQTLSG